MPRKSKANPRAQRQRAVARRQAPLWAVPPEIQTATVVRQTYRYRNQSQAGFTFFVGSLLRACGLCALSSGLVGTVQLSPIAMACKLRRMRFWGAVNNLGNTTQVSTAFATVSVDFDVDALNGGNPGFQFTNSTMSPDRLAYIDVVPPPQSFASFWHSQVEAGEALCITNCALGSIMDVDVEWLLNDDDNIAGIGLTSNTVTQAAGHIYYPQLGNAWVPIGRVANGIA
jgi:hypothetical protein